MNTLIEFFLKKRLFGDILTISILLIGVITMFQIQRDFFPNVTFDIISVRTNFSGASPEEIEKLVVNKIEREVKEVDGIKKLQSISAEGVGYVTAFLDPDITNEIQGKQDIQEVVDRVEPDLPADADSPVVTSIESKQTPIIQVVVFGDLSEIKLRDLAKKVEEDLERIPGVARVVPPQERNKELQIKANPRLLSQYDVTLSEIIATIRNQNQSIPSGKIESDPKDTSSSEFIVRTYGRLENKNDIENTVIRANSLGQPIRIKDVAKVVWGLEEADVMEHINGVPGLRLIVLKKEKADGIRVVDQVRARVDEIESEYKKEGLSFGFVRDVSKYIRKRLSVLTNNLGVGLLLILFILTLILGFRTAMVVSIAIPISFLGAMIFFHFNGMSVNVISLIGLIIVSGMLVDDAVVVTDNAVKLIEEGMDPYEAALKGTKAIWPAVTASVLTTIFAFLPFLFMSGIFGKFIRQVPFGVIIPLIVSLFESFLILPGHVAAFVKPMALRKAGRKAEKPSFWDRAIVPRYVSALKFCVRLRYLTLLGLFALLGGAGWLAKEKMQFVLFPPEGVEAFMIKGTTRTGYSLEQTLNAAKPIEKKLLAQIPKHELNNLATIVGKQQKDPNDPGTKRGSEYFQFYVFLSPLEARDREAFEIMDDLRESLLPKDENGKLILPPEISALNFESVNPGPPVGKPIDVAVRGEEYNDILKGVARLKEMVAEIKGTTDIGDTYTPGKQEYRIIVDPVEASAAGLNVASIGSTVRAALSGVVASTIQKLNDEINIRVSLPDNLKLDLKALQEIKIPNTRGQLIPLMNVSTFEKYQGLASYEHQEGRRQIRVQGNVDLDVTDSTQVNGIIASKYLPMIAKEFPDLDFAFGGEDEDTKESMASLREAFIVAIVCIFLILVMLFNSLIQPAIIMAAIPLGIIAAIFALFSHGFPISFMSMLGIIALGGVIVNNAIVFIDRVNRNRAEGMNRFESIFDAGEYRIRPIFLTTVTTVCGLLPTAYGIGGLDKFVVPIVLVLGWGLLFGSVMTSFAIPALLAITDDLTSVFKRITGREKQSPTG